MEQYAEAVASALAGNQEGYDFLYQSTYQKKFFIAKKYMGNDMDAQDVLQDAYVQAFTKLNTLQDYQKFPNWFGMIVANTAKNALQKKKMLFFSNVDMLEPTSIRWSAIRFQRNNQTYRMLVSICQLIIEGMLITTDSGGYRLASFVDEQRMCRLYEKFILEYYIRHYPMLSVNASQIPWDVEDGFRTMLPVMQSDIHLQKDNTVLIIDAKYYSHTTQSQYDNHTLHSNNMYQIFTYVKNRDYAFKEQEHKVSGMLLYAKTEELIQPDNVYQMHGNQITVRTLDLNLPFADIAKQLDDIAEAHFGVKKVS